MHDLVDNVALEAKQVGKFASEYAQNKLQPHGDKIDMEWSKAFSYVLPNYFFEGEGQCEVKFRLKDKVVRKNIVAKCGDTVLGKRFILAGVPGEMMSFTFDKKGAKGKITMEIV